MHGTIRTYPTKIFFSVLDPYGLDVYIEDIAHHLSREGRFANGTKEFYSVAQHSWHVSHLMPPRLAAWGLLHDASEAYLRDIPSPIKHLSLMAGYRLLESRVQRAIYGHFGLVGDEPSELAVADHQALLYEEYLVRDALTYPAHIVVPPVMHVPWDARLARQIFLERYKELELAGAFNGH